MNLQNYQNHIFNTIIVKNQVSGKTSNLACRVKSQMSLSLSQMSLLLSQMSLLFSLGEWKDLKPGMHSQEPWKSDGEKIVILLYNKSDIDYHDDHDVPKTKRW